MRGATFLEVAEAAHALDVTGLLSRRLGAATFGGELIARCRLILVGLLHRGALRATRADGVVHVPGLLLAHGYFGGGYLTALGVTLRGATLGLVHALQRLRQACALAEL